MRANDIQHGGDHYGKDPIQHWDFTWKHAYNQFEYSATKYIERCWEKNGVEDLKKALHHLQKYMEITKVHPFVRDINDAILYCKKRDMEHARIVIFSHIHIGDVKTAIAALEMLIENTEAEAVNADRE